MELLLPKFGLFFWTLVIFLVLLFLLKKYAWQPILNALEAREARIENALQKAEQAQKEYERLQKERDQLLAEARQHRDEILKEARSMKHQILEEARQKAIIEQKQLLEEAQRRIESEKQEALAALKKEVGVLAVNMAEKILRTQLKDREAQIAYIQRLISQN